MESLSYGIVIGAAAVFLAAGLMGGRRQAETLDSFLTARGTLSAPVAAGTILASALGAWILFSPAEAGSTDGVAAVAGYAVGQGMAAVIYSFIGPRVRELLPGGFSVSDFVHRRYGTAMHALTAVVSLLYMGTFLAAELTAIALALNMAAGTPLPVTIAIVGTATLIYTVYGGIRATIFTDVIQSAIIIPATVAVFIGTMYALGGPGAVVARVSSRAPDLLSFGHGPGLETAVTLFIAITAANLFHAGYWQRVYAAKDGTVVKKSFLTAGVLAIPLVAMAGLFGVMAAAAGPVAEPSAAMFHLLLSTTPDWVVAAALVLAVALVMSSVDTTLNGIAGLFTFELARVRKDMPKKTLLSFARVATMAVAAAAGLVAARGYSVLYLFLLADLMAAAAAFPIFYGLYSRRLDGRGAAAAALAGLVPGVLLFPDPAFTRGSMLWAFIAAAGLSAAVTLAIDWHRRRSPRLRRAESRFMGD